MPILSLKGRLSINFTPAAYLAMSCMLYRSIVFGEIFSPLKLARPVQISLTGLIYSNDNYLQFRKVRISCTVGYQLLTTFWIGQSMCRRRYCIAVSFHRHSVWRHGYANTQSSSYKIEYHRKYISHYSFRPALWEPRSRAYVPTNERNKGKPVER